MSGVICPTSISVKDLHILLEAFPKNPTQDTYLQWKMYLLLVVSTHPVYQTITTQDANNNIALDPSICHTNIIAMFMELATEFGDSAREYVDVSKQMEFIYEHNQTL